MRPVLFLFCSCLCACSPAHKFKSDRQSFESSAVKMSFTSIANMNDAYFVIKENNFFEFYRMLFDSVKNSSYPGRYQVVGDTLLLNFYNKNGAALLGKKAVVDSAKNKISFF